MTVAIKRANGDLLWFDAVLNYGRQFSGSVSKHPLETGAVITDHTTIENEVITLEGILSDVDFNLHRPLIDQQQARTFELQNKQFVNNTPVTSATDGSALYQNVLITAGTVPPLLPESIGQFFGSGAPQVSINPRTPRKVKLAAAIQDDLIKMFKAREEFVLLSFVDEKIGEALDHCIVTSLSFNEDPDSGDAVYPVMTIERVSYATSTSVRIKTQVSADISKKAASQQNKGKVAATGTSSDATSLDKDKPTESAAKTSRSMLTEQIEAATD